MDCGNPRADYLREGKGKGFLLSSKSSVFLVGSQTQIGPPPNYLENDFETTLTERTGANFNNHVLRMITEGQSQQTTLGTLNLANFQHKRAPKPRVINS